MTVAHTIEELRNQVNSLKRKGKKIAFVPTMGALHEGHLSLIRLAQERADAVVISIFVNPTQFGPSEDFGSYPRTIESDLQKCEEEAVDIVFMPTTEMMYGSGKRYFSIEIESLNKYLDGGSRKGFFQGITLVVNKLFNLVEPNLAIFGQKDFQQFRIIEEMVKEFNHNVELVMAPIARAEDGLALSSRNAYLSIEERKIAPIIQQTLQDTVREMQNGLVDLQNLLTDKQKQLKAKGFKNDYLGIYNLETLQPVSKTIKNEQYLIAVAAYLGKTRLIDNIIFRI